MKHCTAFRFGALAMVSGLLGCGAMHASSPASSAEASGGAATASASGGWSGGGAEYAAPSAARSMAGGSSSAGAGVSGGSMAPPPAAVADSAGAPAPVAPRNAAPVAATTGATTTAAAGGSSGAGGAVAAQSSVVAVEQPQPAAGLLTAASVADVDRRDNYLEYLSRHAGEREGLALDMSHRVRIRVVDAQQRPVHNAVVVLADAQQRQVAAARTHADGYWDYFPALWPAHATGHLTAHVQLGGDTMAAVIDVPARGDGQSVTLTARHASAAQVRALELGFAIDVTGSMGDELRYVNNEIASIVQRVRAASPNLEVRVGAVFYRDRSDYQPLQTLAFTGNVNGFAAAMQQITASGGGDYPEDMNRGLDAAMRQLQWSADAGTDRVLVVIADAPPQMYPGSAYTYRDAIRDASQRGIRILPVAASGADRTVEYLFRAMGAATSTPYVYLTDESGVGAPHMEADTDRVAVERFNDLLVRLVTTDLRGEGMHEPGALAAHGS